MGGVRGLRFFRSVTCIRGIKKARKKNNTVRPFLVIFVVPKSNTLAESSRFGVGVQVMKRRGELRLICQAIRAGWKITPKGRHDAIQLVASILEDKDATPREQLAAVKAALLMTESDIAADDMESLLANVKKIGNALNEDLAITFEGIRQ